jgi:hypothetical protein
VLALGAGDHGFGDAGADRFVLTQWLSEGGYATITDYNLAEDQIVLVYDAATHATPDVTVEPMEGQDAVRILIDGQAVATVNGPVAPADIRLLAA